MKTIKIKSNDIGRYDDVSPFLIESGALELKIELPQIGIALLKPCLPISTSVAASGLIYSPWALGFGAPRRTI